MEEIWESVSEPAPDGKRYLTFKNLGGLSFLYVTGFVDVKKYSFKDWSDAFLPSRKKDGSYLVTHEQWIEKKKFRYAGPIGTPFDPTTLEEKEYTETDFVQLLQDGVVPNTYMIDEKAIPQMVANLKAQGKIKGGRILIDKTIKKSIAQLIDNYPSPLRILELMASELIKVKKGERGKASGAAQKSGFAKGKTAQEIAASRLAEMTKTLKEAGAAMPEIPSVSLKELKKKKGPTGGRV